MHTDACKRASHAIFTKITFSPKKNSVLDFSQNFGKIIPSTLIFSVLHLIPWNLTLILCVLSRKFFYGHRLKYRALGAKTLTAERKS